MLQLTFTPTHLPHKQNGIVLIMALIMLVVISLLAAMSVRNATSSEGVNANVRQTQLANQAAETALRYCEDAVLGWATNGSTTATFSASPPGTTTVTFALTYVQDSVAPATPTSMITANWDTTSSANPNRILVLPANTVNRSGISTTFNRPPECMVERLAPSTASNYTNTFSITARGFGPDVSAADGSRTRPIGSEVWLQSSIEIN
jgi:type IV pilus assembly protein PilX